MEQSVREVMTSVSRELDSLASLTSTLQDQLSPHAYAGLDVEAFQSLDSLTQTLSCLALFLASVGERVPPHCRVGSQAALSEICLSALGRRLRGGPGTVSDAERSQCELF